MSTPKDDVRVDLEPLRELVAHLEQALEVAYKIRDNATPTNLKDFLVETSKAAGLAMGIAQEATFLVGDIQTLSKLSPAKTKVPASLLDLIPTKKGSGGEGSN